MLGCLEQSLHKIGPSKNPHPSRCYEGHFDRDSVTNKVLSRKWKKMSQLDVFITATFLKQYNVRKKLSEKAGYDICVLNFL